MYAGTSSRSGLHRLRTGAIRVGGEISRLDQPSRRPDGGWAARAGVPCPEPQGSASWALRGFTSNLRYATEAEATTPRGIKPPLARTEATHAAMIPIRKTAGWWDMAQDERRATFEKTSHHTAIGLEYLPAVARRPHHCRDLGEPFDFITWFEYAPEHEALFDHLLLRPRASREWDHVDREIDIRVVRTD